MKKKFSQTYEPRTAVKLRNRPDTAGKILVFYNTDSRFSREKYCVPPCGVGLYVANIGIDVACTYRYNYRRRLTTKTKVYASVQNFATHLRPVLRSFAVQFGDHLRHWDHLRARTEIS